MTSRNLDQPVTAQDAVSSPSLERLLTKAEAAAALNVRLRFIERCVVERRIGYVKVGKFVRIPEAAIREFIARGSVDSVDTVDSSRPPDRQLRH